MLYVTGSVLDRAVLAGTVDETDVVVSAPSPRGDLTGKTRDVLAELAQTYGFPDEFKGEAAEMGVVLDDLRDADPELDWFYVSPAAGFEPWAPGTATGTYRLGDDLLLNDATGSSPAGAHAGLSGQRSVAPTVSHLRDVGRIGSTWRSPAGSGGCWG